MASALLTLVEGACIIRLAFIAAESRSPDWWPVPYGAEPSPSAFLQASWATAANSGVNCLSVAFLSGLAGPRWLRRLALQAFEAINSYGERELQQYYLEFLAYLDGAQVKWIRCGYLRHLAAAGTPMVRCQEVPSSEAVIGSVGFPHDRGDPKHRFVLSHPWLSAAHPDPDGVKLRTLVGQLNLLDASDEDAVFIDYMSLPQHNKQDTDLQRLEREGEVPRPGEHPAVRTEKDEVLFKRALCQMELLYSVGSTPVIVLPMDDHAEAGWEYISRGWCFFEFSLALSFDNIANAELCPTVRQLRDRMLRSGGDTVKGFREGFGSTRFTERGDKDYVLQLFEQTLHKKASP